MAGSPTPGAAELDQLPQMGSRQLYKIEKFRYGTLGPKVMTSGLEKFLPYSGSLSKAFGVGAPDAAS
jgi:hypothetical protein